MPKPLEICEVIVNGRVFRDWETVWVHQEYGQYFRTFRVTVSEGSPMAKTFQELHITPGDIVEVRLAGERAVTGWIYERQSYYDANRRGVLISGMSKSGDTPRASVIEKGGEFRKVPFQSIASTLLSKHGLGITVFGGDGFTNLPFEQVQVQIGETTFEIIERLARQRGLILTDDKDGNYQAWNIQKPTSHQIGILKEGVNILSARCTVTDMSLVTMAIALNQPWGSDTEWGKEQTQQQYTAYSNSALLGKLARFRPTKFLVEQPMQVGELARRAETEIAWRSTEAIQVQIVKYGWLADNGALWQSMDSAFVVSPMLPVNMGLIIKAVTFTQDSSTGTRTTLDLVNLRALQAGEFPLGSFIGEFPQ